MKNALKFRKATRNDMSIILDFVKGLAEYENMAADFAADSSTFEYWLFDEEKAEVVFVLEGEKEVGFALYFYNFSTFLGKAGIYLEDLFVLQEYRGKGYGKALLQYLAKNAVERGCGRLEWSCLDWNKPSIDFYFSVGAVKMDEWSTYRLSGEALESFGMKQQ